MTCMVYTVTNCWDCAGIRMPYQFAEGFTDGPTSTVLRIPQHLPPLWWAPFWHAVQDAVQVHPVCKVWPLVWYLFTVFFCFLRRHTVAHCVPGLGNCQTTKKTRLRLIPNWNPNGPFFSRPRVEHLFSPSPVDVKWAPMSGTWVPGTWWNPRP